MEIEENEETYPYLAALRRSVRGRLAGCGSSNSGTADTPSPSSNPGSSAPVQESKPATLSGTVVTNGSTSMEKVMGSLIEAFKEVQPNIQVQYTGSGSGRRHHLRPGRHRRHRSGQP